MFPMKFYEYLAAGLPVVSTPLDFAKESRLGLEVGGDVEAFVSAIETQLRRGKLTWSRRCSCGITRGNVVSTDAGYHL